MLTKKTLPVIFVLSLLITWGGGFIGHPHPGCGGFPDALCDSGWPLAFHRVGGILGFDQWLWPNLALDFLFWFLIFSVGWALFRKR